ncbi:MAG: hypothetical protein K2X60_00415 [Xanthobacteraceae bacterium]|nr:hypothetical protein [Xanthobacteraceae bacterium]
MTKPASRSRRRLLSIQQHLTPIMIFAVVVAAMSWAAAWFFADRPQYSNALIGLGCLPIVIAVCAYLIVLVCNVERR